MEMTSEGATLIATVYPLAILVIGFEIRNVPKVVATHWQGTAVLWVTGILLVVGLLLGVTSVDWCVRSVATGVPLNATQVVVIGFTGTLLFWGATLLLLGSLADRLGLLEMLGRRARRKLAASPRRTARTVAYVDKHHPEGRDKS